MTADRRRVSRMPPRQRAAGDLFGTRSAPELPADAAALPEAPVSPTGPPADQAAPRYQCGARITEDLWLRLRAESQRSGDPYGVVLGRAYNRHAAEVATPPTVAPPPADDAFGVSQYRRRSIKGGIRLVQFHLTAQQREMVKVLAATAGVSISEVTRQLLDRYLPPHSPISDTP